MKFTHPPLKECFLNQAFGQNSVDFYRKLGHKGHQGLDLHAPTGTPCYAVFDGTVTKASTDTHESLSAGRYVYVETEAEQEGGESVKYQTCYFHLEHADVKTGDKVVAGQQLGTCDNTGQYTTGAHLHFGLYKYTLKNGAWVRDESNGYGGAIDPEPYMQEGWIVNSSKKQVYADILQWEGRLLKSEGDPNVYLAKSGKLHLFPDELTLWSHGRTLAEIDTVSEGIIEKAQLAADMKFGKSLDVQAMKEMLSVFKNEPIRAAQLFDKYF